MNIVWRCSGGADLPRFEVLMCGAAAEKRRQAASAGSPSLARVQRWSSFRFAVDVGSAAVAQDVWKVNLLQLQKWCKHHTLFSIPWYLISIFNDVPAIRQKLAPRFLPQPGWAQLL